MGYYRAGGSVYQVKFKRCFIPLLSALLLLVSSSISRAGEAISSEPVSLAIIWKYALEFGIPGIAVFFILFLWWRWDEICKKPGVSWLADQIHNFLSLNQASAPLPTADPSHFSVIIARFQNDQNDGYAKLLINSLTGLEGIQVLALETPIGADSARPRSVSEK